MLIQTLLAPKFIILYVYIASLAYTQFRGKIRVKFTRQVFDHSFILSPINAIMYLFSAVPTQQPFLELKRFPELTKLRDNWQVIRDEAQKLLDGNYVKASSKKDDIGFDSFFKKGWKRFYLKWYDTSLQSAQQLCPQTVALLETIPYIKGAMFTLLPKHGRLNKHRDPYAGSLRYHLGLITPNSEKCRIYVDGEPYVWKDGEDVLFDETFIHSAVNETDTDRLILFCDVERPLRNKVATYINGWFSKYFMAESATQNLPGDRVGAINKIFQHYYHLVALGQRLKKANRKTYKILKIVIVAALFYFIFLT